MSKASLFEAKRWAYDILRFHTQYDETKLKALFQQIASKPISAETLRASRLAMALGVVQKDRRLQADVRNLASALLDREDDESAGSVSARASAIPTPTPSTPVSAHTPSAAASATASATAARSKQVGPRLQTKALTGRVSVAPQQAPRARPRQSLDEPLTAAQKMEIDAVVRLVTSRLRARLLAQKQARTADESQPKAKGKKSQAKVKATDQPVSKTKDTREEAEKKESQPNSERNTELKVKAAAVQAPTAARSDATRNE